MRNRLEIPEGTFDVCDLMAQDNISFEEAFTFIETWRKATLIVLVSSNPACDPCYRKKSGR